MDMDYLDPIHLHMDIKMLYSLDPYTILILNLKILWIWDTNRDIQLMMVYYTITRLYIVSFIHNINSLI